MVARIYMRFQTDLQWSKLHAYFRLFQMITKLFILAVCSLVNEWRVSTHYLVSAPRQLRRSCPVGSVSPGHHVACDIQEQTEHRGIGKDSLSIPGDLQRW